MSLNVPEIFFWGIVMKKFYMLMIALFAMLIGATGCGESDPAPEYGVPVTDEDTEIDDADVVEQTDDVNQPEYGVPLTDYDIDATDADIEEVPDEPVVEYGAPYTDYDIDTTDADTEEVSDDPVVEYGAPPVDYDDENPDEMTTDYGPISTKFHK